MKPSTVLDEQKHFSVFSEQKLAHFFVSSVNNGTKMITLLQRYTGTGHHSLLTAQSHLTTSAFISCVQRGDKNFSLQALVVQEHAYILTIALNSITSNSAFPRTYYIFPISTLCTKDSKTICRRECHHYLKKQVFERVPPRRIQGSFGNSLFLYI